nr:MFS transporter [Simiduia agarivorans]
MLAQFEVLTLQHLYPHTGRYGLVRIWGSVGFIVAVLGLGFGLEFLSPAWIPLVGFGLFLSLWLASLCLPVAPGTSDALREPAPVNMGCRQLWLFMLVMFLLQLAHGPYYTFYTLYLQDAGWAEGEIGVLWSLGVVAEILVFLVMHRLLDGVSLRLLLWIAVLLTAVRWLLIGCFPGLLSVLVLAQVLHAASFGVAHAVAIEWVRRRFPASQAGQGQALYSSVSFGAGGAAGALLSGLVWDYSPAGVFLGAALISVLALFFIPKLQEPLLQKK